MANSIAIKNNKYIENFHLSRDNTTVSEKYEKTWNNLL